MPGKLNLPNVGSQKGSTKDTIITILSREWPLSAKELYNRVKRENRVTSVSYQAVHKTIKQLLEQHILEKNNEGYLINKVWIEKTKEFSENLSRIYQTKQNQGSKLVFNTLYDTDKFLTNIMVQNAPKEGEKPFLGLHWNHFWIPLFLSIEEYNIIKENMPKFDVYALSKGDTVIDKWCAKFWEDKKCKKLKTGINCAEIADILIFKDTVIEVFYSQEIKKELDKFYEETKSIDDLDIKHLFENVFQKKTKINVVIHQNKELAEQLKGQTLSYFK